jgi:hypothetical protein
MEYAAWASVTFVVQAGISRARASSRRNAADDAAVARISALVSCKMETDSWDVACMILRMEVGQQR